MIEILKNIFGINPRVDYSELVKNGAIILDVRTKGEYAGGHIKGSINISVDQLSNNLHRLTADRALAFAASISLLRGSACVTRPAISLRAVAATSSTACSNATSFARDGTENPLSFRTNCKDASRISSSVAGGSKLKRVLMLRHMVPSCVCDA